MHRVFALTLSARTMLEGCGQGIPTVVFFESAPRWYADAHRTDDVIASRALCLRMLRTTMTLQLLLAFNKRLFLNKTRY